MFHSKLLNYRKEFYVTHKESCPKNTGTQVTIKGYWLGPNFSP